MLCHCRVTDADVLVAGRLHDTVEDQPWVITGITGHGPPRVANLVAVVTMPPRPAGVDPPSRSSVNCSTGLNTPLPADVKTHMHRQLDLARQRFIAILAA